MWKKRKPFCTFIFFVFAFRRRFQYKTAKNLPLEILSFYIILTNKINNLLLCTTAITKKFYKQKKKQNKILIHFFGKQTDYRWRHVQSWLVGKWLGVWGVGFKLYLVVGKEEETKLYRYTYRNELPRDMTRALRRGVLCTTVQRKKPWFSTHFFQKFLHWLRPGKRNSTVLL